jgi:hypothetical protein
MKVYIMATSTIGITPQIGGWGGEGGDLPSAGLSSRIPLTVVLSRPAGKAGTKHQRSYMPEAPRQSRIMALYARMRGTIFCTTKCVQTRNVEEWVGVGVGGGGGGGRWWWWWGGCKGGRSGGGGERGERKPARPKSESPGTMVYSEPTVTI